MSWLSAMKKYPGLPTRDWPPGEWAALQSRVSSRSRRDPNYKRDGQSTKHLARLKSGYGCCLAWIREYGPIVGGVNAAERWPAAVVERLVEDMKLRGYRLRSIRGRLIDLQSVLRRLDPGADLRHLSDEIQLLPKATPALPAIVLRVSTADLVKFGIEIMDATYEADDLASSVCFRTGLQICQLALRPWRADAFSRIQIGQQLWKTENGWRLEAPQTDTKIKRNASGDYPERLLKYLTRYLEHHRKKLCEGGSGGTALWVIPTGKPFSKGLLHHFLTKATRARFEEAVYPHAFRKCLTTTIAIENSAAIAIAATACGHSLGINEAYYNMASSVSAFAQLGEAIEVELRENRPLRRKRRRNGMRRPKST